jgi:D-tyrosyl-tRNA(Tyr) deacylase
MRLVLQRVTSAAVETGGVVVGSIAAGILILVGVEKGDDPATVDRAAEKIAELRMFSDAGGRMNLNASAASAEVLVVSQFTLAASLERGRRPSFDAAAPAAMAEPLVERLQDCLRRRGLRVASGRFGEHMLVSLVNDGPVTFVLSV